MPKVYFEMQRHCAALAKGASPETKAILERMRAEFAEKEPERRSRFPLTTLESVAWLFAILGMAFAGTGITVWCFD